MLVETSCSLVWNQLEATQAEQLHIMVVKNNNKNNNKIQTSKFEDLIGFIKWLLNQAAPRLANKEMLYLYKMGDFYKK